MELEQDKSEESAPSIINLMQARCGIDRYNVAISFISYLVIRRSGLNIRERWLCRSGSGVAKEGRILLGLERLPG